MLKGQLMLKALYLELLKKFAVIILKSGPLSTQDKAKKAKFRKLSFA